MAIETAAVPRSRRALLAASLGGLAALAAQALGRPAPVRAVTDGDVVLGALNTATATTEIENTTTSATVFRGSSDSGTGVIGASGSGVGVYGSSTTSYGVWGYSGSGTGVVGNSGSNAGVFGGSTTSYGVWGNSGSSFGVWGTSTPSVGVCGQSWAADQPATVGQSIGNSTGVLGYSGASSFPAAPARTGVYGYAAQDATSRGVTGQTTAGRGVNGLATSGRGVNGYAGTGVGVYAAAGSGGTALHAEGRVTFKTAGLATIASGTASKTVTPGIDLTSASKILCTLMGNAGGATAVKRVSVNTTADTFTIYLTAAATSAVKVAWFVIS